MTRKDYELIAKVLKGARDYEEQNPINKPNFFIVEAVAKTLSEVLATENPRFDRARFLSACGVK
jgi:hypothetical protein